MSTQRGSYMGSGKLYLEDIDEPKGLIFLGNCSSFSFQAETQEIEEPDYTTPGGGTDTSVFRIKSLNISYNARHFNIGNISRALYAKATDVPTGTVSAETHTVYLGALVNLKYPGATEIVISTTGGSPVTLVENIDYFINGTGYPEIKPDSAKVLPAGTAVTVAYKYPAHANIQALVASGKRFRLKFLGLNEAGGDRKVAITVHRVNHSPASMNWIGDEFQGMDFTAKAEKDSTISGTGVSQYLLIQDVA